MLTFTVLTCFLSAAIGLTITQDGYYNTRYNHLDVERILNNKRLVNYYAQCLVEKGPCPPQGTEFKRILPEALQTNCARCTEKQRTTAYLAIRRLKKEFPKVWAELQANWDPKGELVSRFINDFESGQATPANTQQSNTIANTIETGTNPPVTTSTEPATVQIILTRFGAGETENEITGSSMFTNNIVPSTAPSAPLPNSQTPEKPQPTDKSITENSNEASFTPVVPISETTSTPERIPKTNYGPPNIIPVVLKTTTFKYNTTPRNYRTTPRQNRITLFFPRPDLGLRLTANIIGQIGDMGTKVIRTGARIADMVISSVQATLG